MAYEQCWKFIQRWNSENQSPEDADIPRTRKELFRVAARLELISDPQLFAVKRILAEVVPGAEVRAFGPRVDGTARKYSDLDLALVSTDAFEHRRIETLKDSFSVSDLPFQVDVLDWQQISPEFRKVIGASYEVVQAREQEKAD